MKNKYIKNLTVNGTEYNYFQIKELEELGYQIEKLPFSIKILLESALRQENTESITWKHIERIANWGIKASTEEVPFLPARVILQDFTGVPAVLDLAAMRAAIKDYVKGSNQEELVEKINPDIPVDLVIDHSVLVDQYASEQALLANMTLELQRNNERYEFLKWAQTAFEQFSVVPPGNGIVHQVNLEYLAKVVMHKEINGEMYLYPDTLVGTDSHTTMINGLGVLGWGVGGIEAEAGMLGQPSYLPLPEVIGVKITGKLQTGVTATDLALSVTELLRKHGVVDKFIEYFGDGVKTLPLADRATIANMAPEYGATCGYFPVDEETIKYLKLTGRKQDEIELIETYLKTNSMFQDYTYEASYSKVLELDLNMIESSLAGPKRPQDRIPLGQMKDKYMESLVAPQGNQGHGLTDKEIDKTVTVLDKNNQDYTMKTGAIVIAAITSCTNTSNPSVMLGAGLLAKKAVEKGLQIPPYVKTSLAPGSKVVSEYLVRSGLQEYLNQLGFNVVGYGCTTCIGNSGPLRPEITKAIQESDLLTVSVLSGNRNFEGRIHPLVKANYLASPIMVVAYALAGNIGVDLTKDAIGVDDKGNQVYLKDIWPSAKEISDTVHKYVTADIYENIYKTIYENDMWKGILAKEGLNYEFDKKSEYIKNPPFFVDFNMKTSPVKLLNGLRILASFNDSVTTDHISPAGSIGQDTPAGIYLKKQGISVDDFNTYGSRRGNHEVMMRGTFANIRIRNKLANNREGGFTTYWPSNEIMPIFDACEKYQKTNTGLVVLAGKDYGMGSSRDWAAKGPMLLGVKAVIAQSYERIHRSNLIMMGVLPLEFVNGESADSLHLTGSEAITIHINDDVKPKELVKVSAVKEDGTISDFRAMVRFDSEVDIECYRNGGILPMVLRRKIMQ